MGPAPLGGGCERGKVPASWGLLHWWVDQPGQKGSLRGSEENAAASAQQAEQGQTSTGGPGHLAALPSLSSTPAVRAEAGS